jgi:hypothetical protein
MDHTQPTFTLTNIAGDLEQLAIRANHLKPTLPADEAHALTEELCAIRALIGQATDRLAILQVKYPEQLEAMADDQGCRAK